MQNNDNQKYIYIRSTRERIPCTEEEFYNYYRDIDAFRKRQQRHGRCVCPSAKRLDCDMDCESCPFKRAGDSLSLECETKCDDGKEMRWVDNFPDLGPTVAEQIEEADLLIALRKIVAELTPDEQAICHAVMESLSERTAAAALNVTRKTFTYRREKLFARLRESLKEFL